MPSLKTPDTVRFLTSEDSEAFSALNEAAFSNNPYFWTDPKHFPWSESESENLVWGAFQNEKLLSYIKVELFQDLHELEKRILGIRTSDLMPHPQFPALYISKVATQPSFQGLGLSLSLRRIAHEIADQLGIRYIIGTTIEGTPRIRTLKTWGYRFVENPRKWNGSFKSDLTPLVGVFDLMESYATVGARDLQSVQMAQAFFRTYRKVIDDWFASQGTPGKSVERTL